MSSLKRPNGRPSFCTSATATRLIVRVFRHRVISAAAADGFADSVLRVDDIFAGAGFEPVRTGTAGEAIRSDSAVQFVVVGAAVECVAACAADQSVVPRPPVN